MMRDHSPFMQEHIRAKAGVKKLYNVDQCANKETGTCTDWYVCMDIRPYWHCPD